MRRGRKRSYPQADPEGEAAPISGVAASTAQACRTRSRQHRRRAPGHSPPATQAQISAQVVDRARTGASSQPSPRFSHSASRLDCVHRIEPAVFSIAHFGGSRSSPVRILADIVASHLLASQSSHRLPACAAPRRSPSPRPRRSCRPRPRSRPRSASGRGPAGGPRPPATCAPPSPGRHRRRTAGPRGSGVRSTPRTASSRSPAADRRRRRRRRSRGRPAGRATAPAPARALPARALGIGTASRSSSNAATRHREVEQRAGRAGCSSPKVASTARPWRRLPERPGWYQAGRLGRDLHALGLDAERRQRRQRVGLGVDRVDRPRRARPSAAALRAPKRRPASATTCSPGMAPVKRGPTSNRAPFSCLRARLRAAAASRFGSSEGRIADSSALSGLRLRTGSARAEQRGLLGRDERPGDRLGIAADRPPPGARPRGGAAPASARRRRRPAPRVTGTGGMRS